MPKAFFKPDRLLCSRPSSSSLLLPPWASPRDWSHSDCLQLQLPPDCELQAGRQEPARLDPDVCNGKQGELHNMLC